MRRPLLLVGLVAVIAVAAACQSNAKHRDSIRISDDVRLEATGDRPMPVEVAWVRGDFVEAFAVHNGVAYIVGDEIEAVELRTGKVRWSWSPDDGLGGSGGVQVGLSDDETVQVIAPYEYEAELRRSSGQLVSFRPYPDGDPPPTFRPFPPPPSPSSFAVETSLGGATARWPDGSPAWKVRVEHPQYDQRPAFEVDDVIILALSSGDVVALRKT